MREDAAGIREYTLRNAHGVTFRFLDMGGIVTAIEVPDRAGRRANVVLGYGSTREYRERITKNYFGATIGRYAGRIAGARFSIDGRVYRLTPNDGPNALHGGGAPGLEAQIWQVRPFTEPGVSGARLSLVSPDGAQGFPGKLTLTLTYRLFADDHVRIDYTARTTRATVLNLTNHSYFNLAGAESGSVADQRLRIDAARWAETDAAGIPTGQHLLVANTPLDFRAERRIGDRIDDRAPMMSAKGGYNHAWVFDRARRGSPSVVARLRDPESGRTLTVLSTEPSLQVYTGDYIDGRDVGPGGRQILPRAGIALETQHLSDSPNRPAFPTTLLRPGKEFRSTTIWRFGLSDR
ncbi:aldose epimerase family protein [Sphingomonas sp.]|uniref:aldose epimerase family protein n=1 Tax=Sphingomonas sp. TaxID=28214 RepID=UPI002EDB8A9D